MKATLGFEKASPFSIKAAVDFGSKVSDGLRLHVK
jgi:hypothetical protein